MNVQQTIIAGIKEQLFFNDYLVLPGFGGFVLKARPAHFSGSGGLLSPSSKTISFNSQLKQNDGILTVWLQARLNCTAAEALSHLHDFAAFCTGVLHAKRRLSLESIGFFYLDFENNTCFEPQSGANFMTASFGLSPISIKELEPEKEVSRKEPVFEDRTLAVPPAPEKRRSVNYRRMLVPVALAFLFLSVVSLIVTNTKMTGDLRSSILGSGSKSTFLPFNYDDLKLLSGSSETRAYVADANGIAGIDLEDGTHLMVRVMDAKVPDPKTARVAPASVSRKGAFEIVLGCFSVPGNAGKLIDKLAAKNIEAHVSDRTHKGMTVVCVGNFATREEALDKLGRIKESSPNAWIKKAE